jgi:hypothetical protein
VTGEGYCPALGERKGRKDDEDRPFGALTAAAGVLVAVGMLLTMVALVEPAEAAFPGQNGKIALVSGRDGDAEIYTMNSSDGTALDRLTSNPASDSLFDWQPL